jgi:hypothetical protein
VSGFVRVAGALERRFPPAEASVLATLVEDLRTLIDVGGPEDAVLARLAPAAYEEAGDAAEFADYSRPRVLDAKAEGAEAVLADLAAARGGVVRVPLDRVPLWLRALTDLRLALFERSGGRPTGATEDLADWLGWLLGQMLEELESGPTGADAPRGRR